MKKIAVLLSLSALFLGSTTQAAPASETPAASNTDHKIEVPSQIKRMDSDEFYKFSGSYDLPNGKSLSLFNRGRKLYAVMQGEASHEIVATGPNTFVALDKKMKMRIDRQDNGDVSGELFLAVEPQRLANGDVTSEHAEAIALR